MASIIGYQRSTPFQGDFAGIFKGRGKIADTKCPQLAALLETLISKLARLPLGTYLATIALTTGPLNMEATLGCALACRLG